jgi:ABC-type multidrug transport system fused ATPase/permease subunit
MVLNEGEIVEMGTNEELLKIPTGHYRKLYESQMASNGYT